MKFRVQPCVRENGIWIKFRVVTGRGLNSRVLGYYSTKAAAQAEADRLNATLA